MLKYAINPFSYVLCLTIYVWQEGRSALHIASTQGYTEAVAALTLNGADVSSQDFVSNVVKLSIISIKISFVR